MFFFSGHAHLLNRLVLNPLRLLFLETQHDVLGINHGDDSIQFVPVKASELQRESHRLFMKVEHC